MDQMGTVGTVAVVVVALLALSRGHNRSSRHHLLLLLHLCLCYRILVRLSAGLFVGLIWCLRLVLVLFRNGRLPGSFRVFIAVSALRRFRIVEVVVAHILRHRHHRSHSKVVG
uniref:(northern house mosquito) hypothetical protein n=1 Tax=Culex pipiens TaxID=7175 RepID=A0A8D8GQG0_CULPI